MDTFESERDTNLRRYWSNIHELGYVKNKIKATKIKFIKFIIHKRIVCELSLQTKSVMNETQRVLLQDSFYNGNVEGILSS